MVLFSCRFRRIGCATPPCWSCWAHCSSADGLVCVVGLFPVAGVVALSGAALLNVVCYALYSWLLEFMLAFASLVATICRSAEDRLFGGAGVLLLLLVAHYTGVLEYWLELLPAIAANTNLLPVLLAVCWVVRRYVFASLICRFRGSLFP
ncbi:hypothetical protein NC652_033930 [Populus alba x Populus x berolinensis]|nr:hypothetical protein NC652_033930 [Populus alba x Populus x berolinensis]